MTDRILARRLVTEAQRFQREHATLTHALPLDIVDTETDVDRIEHVLLLGASVLEVHARYATESRGAADRARYGSLLGACVAALRWRARDEHANEHYARIADDVARSCTALRQRLRHVQPASAEHEFIQRRLAELAMLYAHIADEVERAEPRLRLLDRRLGDSDADLERSAEALRSVHHAPQGGIVCWCVTARTELALLLVVTCALFALTISQ